MSRLIHTDRLKLDLSGWETQSIDKVFAGRDCIMALNTSGECLQVASDPEIEARTEYWTRITDIAISKFFRGVAVGLVSDGTCLIAKRPIRAKKYNLERINAQVKSWKGIVQVAASDALFALDNMGKVYYVGLSDYMGEYNSVTKWENIVKIVPGNQDSIFGITDDGRVMATGCNCVFPYNKTLEYKLSKLSDVIDLYPTGSECELIYALHRDGSVSVVSSSIDKLELDYKIERLDGYYNYTVIGLTTDKKLVYLISSGLSKRGDLVFDDNLKVRSFTVDRSGNVIAAVD